MVFTTSAAVTGAPVLKRRPFRRAKTYVFCHGIFGKLAASSGTTRKPAGAACRPSLMRLEQTVEYSGSSSAGMRLRPRYSFYQRCYQTETTS
jgi:hypothetical protein